ncbi:MAG: hypothetical protein R6U64_06535, partial [Bacteroidales bacterium]
MLLILGMLNGPEAKAQFHSVGQDPASVRWSQVQTEHFQVIFPEEYLQKARYVADVLEYAYTHGGKSLGHNPRKVPVIIHNQTVVANGFVSWAPKRLEMYTNPPQDHDGHDWMESLAVHEFRHVVQIDKLNQGITRVLSTLLGEQATGIVLGLYVPLWFMEGDAVAIETALTNAGRGRLPRFEQGLRAQVLQKGIWSYDKAVFGSFKDHIPNQYELGYQLVAAARSKYGAGVWDGVIDNVARRPYSITPFSGGIKKNMGYNKVDHYKATFGYLDSAWTHQSQLHDYTPLQQVNQPQKLYSNYRYLSFLDDQHLIALKSGLADMPRMVKIDREGNEENLFAPGYFNAYAFSTGGNKIVWSEVRNDPRWTHRSWSEIHVYDLVSGKRKRITSKSRYFAPAINKDATRIAAVEVTPMNDYSLVILDAATGKVLQRVATATNDFLITPSWDSNGETIIAVALSEKGKRIVRADPATGAFTTIWGPTLVEISRPVSFQDDIIFNAAFNGIDNIYRLDEKSGDVHQIISSEFGAVDAAFSADGNQVAWSDYSSQGYQVALTAAGQLKNTPLEAIEDHSVQFWQQLVSQEGAVVTPENVPQNAYEAKPYSRLANLFHLHSWGPYAMDVDNLEGSPGASLFLQNKLSTSFASLGYQYDVNEQTGKYYLNYTYRGWYPVMELQAETSERNSLFRDQNQQIIQLPWRENSVQLAVSVPLSFRRYNYFYGVTPSVRTGWIQSGPVQQSRQYLEEQNIWNVQYRLAAYRQVFSVRRDIRPRWGQVVDINFRHTPFEGGEMGYIFSSRLVGYFPGLINHHSLQLSGAYQKQQRGNPVDNRLFYTFSNMINYPRGIAGQYHEELYSFSADYGFPLFYPDWSLPPVLYLQRVRMNLFADYAWG